MENPAFPLTQWYAAEGRPLPWRETTDPYKIWLSEVILQQTRIDQGTSYYLRFIEHFPTVHDLAAADNDMVMKFWEGLGYYSRARNLHHTAKVVSQEMGGVFPDHYKELLKLKGIGPYTARAIGSIAFGNKTGVLDGNVFRVLSRYRGDFSPIDVPATRNSFQEILDAWIQDVNPADFNQALMDLGATVCTPKKPSCSLCPLSPHCVAYRDSLTDQLPVKIKKLKRRTVYHHFFLVGTAKGKLSIRKRPPSGLWANLWEIPNVEVTEKEWNSAPLADFVLEGAFKHVFTHLDMMIKIYQGPDFPDMGVDGHKTILLEERDNYAFSRAVLKIFERYLPGIS